MSDELCREDGCKDIAVKKYSGDCHAHHYVKLIVGLTIWIIGMAFVTTFFFVCYAIIKWCVS